VCRVLPGSAAASAEHRPSAAPPMTDRNNQCYVRVTRVQWAAWSIVPSITLNEPWTPRQTWATHHWECSCLILPLKYGVHAYCIYLFLSRANILFWMTYSYNILERKLLCKHRGRWPPYLSAIESASQDWDWATYANPTSMSTSEGLSTGRASHWTVLPLDYKPNHIYLFIIELVGEKILI
jgi:hypothetical protein